METYSPHQRELRSVINLIRRGRFSEALQHIQGYGRKSDLFSRAVLADLLQRTGYSDQAELIARDLKVAVSSDSQVTSRAYFVLGNVFKERGDIPKSIEHYLTAEKYCNTDVELLCWIQLRLLISIADANG